MVSPRQDDFQQFRQESRAIACNPPAYGPGKTLDLGMDLLCSTSNIPLSPLPVCIRLGYLVIAEHAHLNVAKVVTMWEGLTVSVLSAGVVYLFVMKVI